MPCADMHLPHVARTSFIKAEEFEPKTRAELLDPALSGWVHHVQAILPQGRCKWVNTIPPKEPTGDEDEEEEEEGSGPEPEVGPPLLHPLQNDDREFDDNCLDLTTDYLDHKLSRMMEISKLTV